MPATPRTFATSNCLLCETVSGPQFPVSARVHEVLNPENGFSCLSGI